MFEKASDLNKRQSNGRVYASDNLETALELCAYQKKMINSIREELDKLEDSSDD